MKLLGVAITRDHNEAKLRRRLAFAEEATVEFFIEHGFPAHLNKKYIWRLDGEGCLSVYCLHLPPILCCAVRRIWRRIVNCRGQTAAQPPHRK
jgi:hypothetical protein